MSSFEIDDYDLPRFTAVAASFGLDRYAYVVTPNADHLIRLTENAPFRDDYREAGFVLLDSRFIARLLSMTQGQSLPVCVGSELTGRLFDEVIQPDDPLVVIGGSAEQAQALAARYGLTRLAHHNPPMGFIKDPVAVEACLSFIEAHSPFRYCLIGVGSPQQERVAALLKQRGRARGLALCIGASINFLTGAEVRAPAWMLNLGLEWLFRLLQSPRRLARRYLVSGPRIFGLLRRMPIVLRPATVLPPAAGR